MNSPTLETPATAPQTGEPLYLVAVKISILLPIPKFFPDGNYAGGLILSAALTRALRDQDLILHNSSVGIGDLNDFFHCSTVKSLPSAIAAVESVLEESYLSVFSTVLFYDAKEDFFRPHGPDGAGISTGFTMGNMRDTLARGEAARKPIREVMRKLWDENRRQRGLPPADPENPTAPQA